MENVSQLEQAAQQHGKAMCYVRKAILEDGNYEMD